MAALFKLGAADAAMVGVLARVPVFNTKLILAWVTLRLRPFSLSALARAWWRSITVDRGKRASLQPLLSGTPDRDDMAAHASAARAQI